MWVTLRDPISLIDIESEKPEEIQMCESHPNFMIKILTYFQSRECYKVSVVSTQLELTNQLFL